MGGGIVTLAAPRQRMDVETYSLGEVPPMVDSVPRWYRYDYGWKDVITLGAVTTGSLTLIPLPPGMLITGAVTGHTSQWTSSAATAMTVKVGITGWLTKWVGTSATYFTAPLWNSYISKILTSTNSHAAWTWTGGSTNQLLTCTATGGNLNTMTGGAASVFLLLSKLEPFV